MKFNKQLSNGGLFLPSAALKISGFEDSGQVEIHALKNTAVIMKQQMTAMELIQALDSLNQLFINLSFHLAKTCGACSGCEGECPFGDFEYDKIELDDDLRKEAGIPTDAKLSLYWGVAQRRKRIFLVADFAGRSAPQILFEQDSLLGNPAPSGCQREGTSIPTQTGFAGTGRSDGSKSGSI